MVITSKKQDDKTKQAIELHRKVPADWYEVSIKENIFQRIWHAKRAKKIKEVSSKISGEVLDIGSADGFFTNIILQATQAKKVTGIDILETSVEYSRERYKGNRKLAFSIADAHALPFPDKKFEAVYIIECLEHAIDPKKVFLEINRVLKPNGYVVILVPSENLLFRVIWFLWTHTRGKIWQETHIHSFTSQHLKNMVSEMSFLIEKEEFFLLRMLHVLKVKKI